MDNANDNDDDSDQGMKAETGMASACRLSGVAKPAELSNIVWSQGTVFFIHGSMRLSLPLKNCWVSLLNPTCEAEG
jgi:hypothetical protein